MDKEVLGKIEGAYNWQEPEVSLVHSGLINHTWKVVAGGKSFLLQSVNTKVFAHPEQIDENLNNIASFLRKTSPEYLFTAPVKTSGGESLLNINAVFYRVFDWVPGSHTIDVVSDPGEAYEAAHAFGLFTYLLRKFDAQSLYITLPGFHDLALRYYQFERSLQNGNPERITECADEIRYLQSIQPIVNRYNAFIRHPEVRIRVTHHDTKISNILFNEQRKGLCVIDLDTVMPGYFLSDVGDMFRTYVCPVSEEEKNPDLVVIRKEYLEAIEKGYLANMGNELSNFEKDHFYFGGEALIYMQALRFLADYLKNDRYYGSRYPGQNLVRTRNQVRLLSVFRETI